jgi:hypothetical protein
VAPCVFVALFVVTAPGHKSVFFGFTLAAFALFAFLIFARLLFGFASGSTSAPELAITRQRASRYRFVIAVAFVGMALLTARTPWSHRSGGAAELESTSVSRQRYAALAGVVNAIRPDGEESIRVYVPGFTPYLNEATVRFELAKRRLGKVAVSGEQGSGAIDDVLQEIARATYVVLPNDVNSELLAYLPSTPLIPKLRAYLAADADFHKIARIAGIGSDSFDIFERKRPFGAAEFGMGFLATEGPYPQWNLPVVKWALGPRALLKLKDVSGGPRHLTLTMQSHIPRQRISVYSGTMLLGVCELPVAGKLVECGVPLHDMQPGGEIALEFAQADLGQSVPRAVLFHSIGVQ